MVATTESVADHNHYQAITIQYFEVLRRIHALSAPRRTRALTALCADLTATQTTYPGTGLTLTYSVKQH